MTSLRDAAAAAYESQLAEVTTAAYGHLAEVLDGYDVAALTVADHECGPTYALVVFTDGDLHLAVRHTGDAWDVHLAVPAAGGVAGWSQAGPSITSLAQLGEVLPEQEGSE